jgi:hypothetical protein
MCAIEPNFLFSSEVIPSISSFNIVHVKKHFIPMGPTISPSSSLVPWSLLCSSGAERMPAANHPPHEHNARAAPLPPPRRQSLPSAGRSSPAACPARLPSLPT